VLADTVVATETTSAYLQKQKRRAEDRVARKQTRGSAASSQT
jgi:hypothetical protein